MSKRDDERNDDERNGDDAGGVRDDERRGERHDERGGAPPCVVITGFMAAGKTTVARALAARLGCEMLDTDELVRERAGRTPAEIIDAEGESRFRELESRVLGEALSGARPLVVALGGGAWSLAANRELIAARGCLTVWLDAPFELCRQRIEGAQDAPERPLARDPARARALYDARRADYALAARRVEVSAGMTAASVAEEIAKLVGRSQHEGQTKDTRRDEGHE
jgi:shikimate kinase